MTDNEKASLSGALLQDYCTIADGTLSTILIEPIGVTRWGVALKAGLIRLVGKVLALRTGECCINFTTDILPVKLEEAITAACWEAYRRTLERVHAGDMWLVRNRDTPDFAEGLEQYERLLERLRELWLAAGGDEI